MNKQQSKPKQATPGADFIGAEAAMRRAAGRARRIAEQTGALELFKPLGPDGNLGGLTQQEIGEIRRRIAPTQK